MKVITSSGEDAVLEMWRAPHKPSSTGKVFVRMGTAQREFYPSVIGGEFCEPKN
jgi:hypothetical protein